MSAMSKAEREYYMLPAEDPCEWHPTEDRATCRTCEGLWDAHQDHLIDMMREGY